MVLATARARGHATWSVRLSIAPGAGLPARARQARRAALREAAAHTDAIAIATGHTMTDQAETVLLNLTRGTALRGLAAMAPHEPWEKPTAGARRSTIGVWLRPLLHLERDQSRAIAERLGLPFVDDPGNLDEGQPRVRVRRRVLAELAAINPAVVAHLAATARAARAACETDDATDDIARAVDSAATVRHVALGRTPADLRALVLRLCRDAGVAADAVAQRTLDGIVASLAAAARARHRWDLRGVVLHHEAGEVWIERREQAHAPLRSSSPTPHRTPDECDGTTGATIDPP
jgi:tRNA(Ile)-lysidine synthase